MPSSTPRRRTAWRGLALGLVLVSMASPFAAQAQQDFPEDDGAPPEEYAPSVGGEALEYLVAELPTSPPADNAFPIQGALRSACTDSFGDPRGAGRTHLGVDCFAALGTPLVATEAGTIRYATAGEPYSCTTGGDISGNRVSLRGRSGYLYYYGHLDRILVWEGQEVAKGQIIGTLGRTGNAACSGAHLHLEVRCETGDPFDPYPAMATWGRSNVADPAWPSTELLGAGTAFSGPDRFDLFALECGRVIRQKVWVPNRTSAWYPVDGWATSDPDATSPGPGSLPQVFVKGPDNVPYQIYVTGSRWEVFGLGTTCSSGPAAVFSSRSHLDVFCVGPDRALWQRAWDASTGWNGAWFRVGGTFTSDPDAASAGSGQAAQVFVRGVDNAVYQFYWEGTRWVAVNLGGYCTSGPSAAFSGADRADVFCRGTDLALYHRYWLRTSGWSPTWQRIDTKIISDPEAVSRGQGSTPQVFVRGVDRRVYQFYWTGSTWASSEWGVT